MSTHEELESMLDDLQTASYEAGAASLLATQANEEVEIATNEALAAKAKADAADTIELEKREVLIQAIKETFPVKN